MTLAQQHALAALCERYHVTFNEADYAPRFDLPAGYVAGWVGGLVHAATTDYGTAPGKTTIYVGVSPEGEVSS